MMLALIVGTSTSAAAQHDHGPKIPVAGGLPHGIPNFCASATIVAVSDGAWSNPSTWKPNRVPAAGDKVSIPNQVAVAYDAVSDAAVVCVEVRGQLTFRSDINTRLTVGTLTVNANGLLQIGTPAAPISAAVTAEIVIADQPLDTTFDPEQFGTGIIGVGTIRISGQPRTPFARLTSEPAAGATTLATSQTLSGWRSGDKLFVPDTRHLSDSQRTPYSPQWEERIAASVGTTAVTVSSPLAFDHAGARDGAGALTFLPHIANLTRNVIIRSANPGGTRGHMLFAVRAAVDIRYALLKDLGRTTIAPLNSTTVDASGNVTHVGTNQIGRYPLHLHHAMGSAAKLMGSITQQPDGYQYRLIGNAIDGGRKWGIVVHNTHFGLVQQNVVYNVDGAGISTEDGSESNNVIEANFVARINGPGGRGDERGMTDTGWEGTGIWMRGTNNIVRDNVVVNVPLDYGFKYFSYLIGNVTIPKFPGADTTVGAQGKSVPETTLPIKEFARNEVYGATQGGLTYWWITTQENHPTPPGAGLSALENVIKDFHVWHVWDSAIYNYPSDHLTIDGLVVRGKGAAQSSYSRGIKTNDYMARNMVINNADIQGVMYGITPSTNSGGGVQVIQNSYLRNAVNISIQTQWTAEADARNIPARQVIIRNVRFDTPVVAPPIPARAIEFAYSAGAVRNLIQRDEVYVYEYNGNASDNFKAYYAQQQPSFIVPETVLNQYSSAFHSVEGAPVAGLTNQQAWNSYGIAIGGSIAPCTTTRADNDGVACPIAWVPPSTAELLRTGAPSPPRNVAIRH